MGLFLMMEFLFFPFTFTHTLCVSQERDKCIWKEEPGRGSWFQSQQLVSDSAAHPAPGLHLSCRAWAGHSAPKPSTAQQTFAQAHAGNTGPGTEQKEGSAKLEWLDSLVDRPMGGGRGGPGSRGLAQPPRPAWLGDSIAPTRPPRRAWQLGSLETNRQPKWSCWLCPPPRYLQDTCLGLRLPR